MPVPRASVGVTLTQVLPSPYQFPLAVPKPRVPAFLFQLLMTQNYAGETLIPSSNDEHVAEVQ